ncbi:MAG: TonB family protein [Sinobacteraceae bacterium]|nr:TonB family protein [Nevskiaceae bacterium]
MDHAAPSAALPEGHRVEGYDIEALLEQRPYDGLYRVRDAAGRRYWLREFFPSEYAVRESGGVHARAAEDRNALRWWLRSFLDQGLTLARLGHPGLERVLRVFEAGGTGYWLCEAPAGERLDALLERGGALAEETLRRILIPVLDGLELAHGAGLLHREICPHQLVVRGDEGARLVGFGVLRAPIRLKARTLHGAGTPPYAAPEEASPTAPRGPWTDLYALGATAYHAAYDRPPHEQSAPVAPAREYSESFLAAIAAALQPQPELRPQSVTEWRERLKLPATTPAMPGAGRAIPTTPAVPTAKPTHRGVSLGWSLIPLALVAAALLYWRFRPQAPGPAPQPGAAALSATPTPAPAAQQPLAPVPPPTESGASANPPAAASAGALDRLALELMAKEKKAQEARNQQQVLQQQREQNAKAASAAVPEASAPPPSPAEIEAAARARALEQEVARLKAQQEALQKATAARKAQAPAAAQPTPTLTLTESAYYPALLKKIQGAVQYPSDALRNQEEGTCTVRVSFDRNGQILEAVETRRIGMLDLDRECRDVFGRLGQLPPVPANVEPDRPRFVVELPITFRLP